MTLEDIQSWTDAAINQNQGSVLLDALFDVVRGSPAGGAALPQYGLTVPAAAQARGAPVPRRVCDADCRSKQRSRKSGRLRSLLC